MTLKGAKAGPIIYVVVILELKSRKIRKLEKIKWLDNLGYDTLSEIKVNYLLKTISYILLHFVTVFHF